MPHMIISFTILKEIYRMSKVDIVLAIMGT